MTVSTATPAATTDATLNMTKLACVKALRDSGDYIPATHRTLKVAELRKAVFTAKHEAKRAARKAARLAKLAAIAPPMVAVAPAKPLTRKQCLAAIKAHPQAATITTKGVKVAALRVIVAALPTAKKPVDPNRGLVVTTRSRARNPSPTTLARLSVAVKAALANTPKGESIVVIDAMTFVASGLGKCWVSTSNKRWQDPASMHARSFASLGYTAQSTRGTIVLTPIAVAATKATKATKAA